MSLLPLRASTGHFTRGRYSAGSRVRKDCIQRLSICCLKAAAVPRPRPILSTCSLVRPSMWWSMMALISLGLVPWLRLNSSRIQAIRVFNRLSLMPAALKMASFCWSITSRPLLPCPASITTNLTSLFLAATMGAMAPPSLWPPMPRRLGSTCGFLRTALKMASASSAKRRVSALSSGPVLLPTPRSS